jgi:uncharacterized protein (TIRG00374 family)
MAEPQRFSESRFRRLEYTVVLSMVAFAIVFAGLSLWVGVGGVVEHLKDLTPGLVVVLLSLSLSNYLLRGLRWEVFTRALRLDLPWSRNLLYYFAGFAMTTTPGKAGEALRLWLIERCHGYGYRRTAPMFVADRLSDMIAVLLLGLIGVGAFSRFADATLAAGVALFLVVIAFFRPQVLLGLIGMIYKIAGRRRPRLFSALRQTVRGTASLFMFRVFGAGLVLALLGWFAEAYSFYLLLGQFGAVVTLQQVIFIFTFAMSAGTLAMLPGGLGGTEAVMIGLLKAIGVDFEAAVAATAIIRLTTLWYAVILGFLTLPFAMRLARRRGSRLVAEAAG